jgi:hypothetical protein
LIGTIIIAVGIALAALVVALNGAQIATGVVDQLMGPVNIIVTKAFMTVAVLSPLLIAVVPVALALGSRDENGDMDEKLVFGAVFGLALFALATLSGVSDLLVQEMRGSWAVGSAMGMAVSGLGALGGFAVSALEGLTLWGAGIALSVLGSLLDGLAGLGRAAEKGKKPIGETRRRVLDRLRSR